LVTGAENVNEYFTDKLVTGAENVNDYFTDKLVTGAENVVKYSFTISSLSIKVIVIFRI
jgi:hypothetical protein